MDRKGEPDRTGRGENVPVTERVDRGADRAVAVPPGTADDAAPEVAREPVPDVRHEPEPDARNLIPAKDQPGTL